MSYVVDRQGRENPAIIKFISINYQNSFSIYWKNKNIVKLTFANKLGIFFYHLIFLKYYLK